jgi:hypothetical protein
MVDLNMQKKFARQSRSLLILMTESLEKVLVTLLEEEKEALCTWVYVNTELHLVVFWKKDVSE